MKRLEFNLGESAYNIFFPEERIKTKPKIIEILLEATRYMLSNPKIEEEKVIGKMILYVDKMSRIFFYKSEKYYSISFPFFVRNNNEKLEFIFNHDINVNSELISNVKTVLNSGIFDDKSSLGFADPIYDYEVGYDDNFWIFIRELILLEDGYIRYDIDEENYLKAKAKGEEKKHPLTHYDLFYSNSATFKIGLDDNVLSEGEFIDVLDTTTDCKYLG